MSELIKRLITAMTLCLTALLVHAQEWTKEDSLRLRKLLDSDQELNLNQDAVRQIDFGSAVGTPRMSVEKKWMLPDESLPEALPKPKVVLSLMPYKANTPYNWDPVFQKKIRMDKNAILKAESRNRSGGKKRMNRTIRVSAAVLRIS